LGISYLQGFFFLKFSFLYSWFCDNHMLLLDYLFVACCWLVSGYRFCSSTLQ
jgi:hypothetical protein